MHQHTQVVLATTAGLMTLAVCLAADGVEHHGVMYQNTLTLVNTHLLLWTGVLSVLAVHAHTMKLPVSIAGYLVAVCCIGGCFLLVQCCEYVHLYWCLYTDAHAHTYIYIYGCYMSQAC